MSTRNKVRLIQPYPYEHTYYRGCAKHGRGDCYLWPEIMRFECAHCADEKRKREVIREEIEVAMKEHLAAYHQKGQPQ